MAILFLIFTTIPLLYVIDADNIIIIKELTNITIVNNGLNKLSNPTDMPMKDMTADTNIMGVINTNNATPIFKEFITD
jgi:hypothetical protein